MYTWRGLVLTFWGSPYSLVVVDVVEASRSWCSTSYRVGLDIHGGSHSRKTERKRHRVSYTSYIFDETHGAWLQRLMCNEIVVKINEQKKKKKQGGRQDDVKKTKSNTRRVELVDVRLTFVQERTIAYRVIFETLVTRRLME